MSEDGEKIIYIEVDEFLNEGLHYALAVGDWNMYDGHTWAFYPKDAEQARNQIIDNFIYALDKLFLENEVEIEFSFEQLKRYKIEKQERQEKKDRIGKIKIDDSWKMTPELLKEWEDSITKPYKSRLYEQFVSVGKKGKDK